MEELRPQVVGRRVRSAVLDRGGRRLYLGFAPKPVATLALSFLREAPGPFLLPRPPALGDGESTDALKKLLSARVVAFEAADLDRVVTLTVAGTRLSGRTAASKLVLEILGARCDLYLVDAGSSTVFAVFSSARARLEAGERYQPPPPPPAAAPPAQSGAEVEARLAVFPVSRRRTALLAATGTTPLLVREIEWLIDREGVSAGDAFARVRARLDEKRAFLYASPGRHCLLSPLELRCESAPREFGSFSEAMAEAVSLETETSRRSAVRARMESALARRRERLRRLRENLERDEASLEEPALLRRRGELLLAGLSQALRASDGKSVRLRDLYDPASPEIEIEVDPRLSLPKNAERLFDRARRAERARVELSKRRDSVATELAFWEGFECDLRDASTEVELDALELEAEDAGLASKGKPPKRRAPEALGPRRFQTLRGNEILVGRSGRSNDELTFGVAKPEDLWFHAAGIPGAHVVLRVSPGAAPDEAEIQRAAELAAYFSKARGATAADVIVAERRHVSRIKGAPRGTVKIASAPEVTTRRAAPRGPDPDGEGVI